MAKKVLCKGRFKCFPFIKKLAHSKSDSLWLANSIIFFALGLHCFAVKEEKCISKTPADLKATTKGALFGDRRVQ